ncbi:MAG: hypothetical protein EPO08_04740 [Rhodospirillaceae bacterium]|nr:MAG: hypothetical protein EPO08_04740 [Rhodospirillaceae bacterium]
MNLTLFRLAIALASIFVASLIVAGAVVALGGFSYVALLNVMPAPAAAFISILACLLAAVIIIIGGQWAIGHRCTPPKSDTNENARNQLEDGAILEALGGLAGKEAADLIREYPQASSLAALAAGFAVGAHPELRDLLRRFLAR